MATIESPLATHKIVSPDQWLKARRALLAKEKELTHQRDALAAERRELPWVRVDKQYVFEATQGKVSLADLFDGRSQLIVYHFMLGPEWKEGCVGCSFLSDHVDGALVHLRNHDVSLVVVSRGPLAEISRFKKRMGWEFPWVSSQASDFNFDYHVSFREDQVASGKVDYNFETTDRVSDELPGASVFYTRDGEIFHTYSCYARGLETLISAYSYLDLTPKGRNETGPRNDLSDWVRHHDRYPSATLTGIGTQDAGSCGCSEEKS